MNTLHHGLFKSYKKSLMSWHLFSWISKWWTNNVVQHQSEYDEMVEIIFCQIDSARSEMHLTNIMCLIAHFKYDYRDVNTVTNDVFQMEHALKEKKNELGFDYVVGLGEC